MASYGTRKDAPLGPPVGGEIGGRASRGSSPPTRSNFHERQLAHKPSREQRVNQSQRDNMLDEAVKKGIARSKADPMMEFLKEGGYEAKVTPPRVRLSREAAAAAKRISKMNFDDLRYWKGKK